MSVCAIQLNSNIRLDELNPSFNKNFLIISSISLFKKKWLYVKRKLRLELRKGFNAFLIFQKSNIQIKNGWCGLGKMF